MSRSAEGATIIALLPPSSRIARPKRAATLGPTIAPMRVEPVAETIGTSLRGDERLADRRPADHDLRRAPRARRRRSASAPRVEETFIAASAVKGVFSDGFQITGSPQTSASAAFQAQTATGKLKAEITAQVPSGARSPSCGGPDARRRWSDRRAGARGRRRSRRCRSSPALRRAPRRRSCPPRASPAAPSALLRGAHSSPSRRTLAAARRRDLAPGAERRPGAGDRPPASSAAGVSRTARSPRRRSASGPASAPPARSSPGEAPRVGEHSKAHHMKILESP